MLSERKVVHRQREELIFCVSTKEIHRWSQKGREEGTILAIKIITKREDGECL